MGLIFKTIHYSNTNIDKSDIYLYLKLHIGHLHILRVMYLKYKCNVI